MFDICVLGSANLDFFFLVSHLPAPGETLQATSQFEKFGGKGANQAVAAAKCNGKTCFLGQVGKDGNPILEYIKAQKVDCSAVRLLENQRTGHAIINLADDKENSIVIVGGANMHYPNSALPQSFKEYIQKSKYLLLQKEVPQEINLQALKEGKQHKVNLVLDCGGRDDKLTQELIQQLDWLSPNQTELDRVYKDLGVQGMEGLFGVSKKLKVLLKKGEEGCQIRGEGLDVSVPSVTGVNGEILKDYEILDTVGAGDCFTSAFFVRFSELGSEETEGCYKKAMMFANAAAFLCITVQGAMNSMPERRDLDAFMQKYLKDWL